MTTKTVIFKPGDPLIAPADYRALGAIAYLWSCGGDGGTGSGGPDAKSTGGAGGGGRGLSIKHAPDWTPGNTYDSFFAAHGTQTDSYFKDNSGNVVCRATWAGNGASATAGVPAFPMPGGRGGNTGGTPLGDTIFSGGRGGDAYNGAAGGGGGDAGVLGNGAPGGPASASGGADHYAGGGGGANNGLPGDNGGTHNTGNGNGGASGDGTAGGLRADFASLPYPSTAADCAGGDGSSGSGGAAGFCFGNGPSSSPVIIPNPCGDGGDGGVQTFRTISAVAYGPRGGGGAGAGHQSTVNGAQIGGAGGDGGGGGGGGGAGFASPANVPGAGGHGEDSMLIVEYDAIPLDNTVNLTGVSATAAVGDFSIQAGSGTTVRLTGVSATAHAGTFSLQNDHGVVIYRGVVAG